ncbi:O-methyltransferase [Candidatus Ulvibacter alkanivorans]|uniref:O-methyltransferase n=1 Tax=Candidatus Ulvibacter alkanivorans TaxID=2267620 RepID=UPI000DF21B97|nr:class I SAM-dependent methyltransferase [Candidatus Ulvibacter alkanivorans]
MLYQIRSYLQFLTKATNQHGVHSPYVYDLITNCFYDKKKYPEYQQIHAYRKQLLNDRTPFKVTDFGKGSTVFKSDERVVASVAKHVGISAKRQRLLFRLSRYLKPENSLELGTSLGLATIAMALGNKSSSVLTVEGCPNTAAIAVRQFESHRLDNIRSHTCTFDTFFSENASEVYHLVFVDGHHSKEYTLQYFEQLLKRITSNSILIFDDIYWSPGMTEAWEEIKAHPTVRVSIDTFTWGLVFFRKEQQKEHFYIRL